MKWKLKVAEDATEVKHLVFRSYADARRFLDFTNVYMDETGCGNGYSAYWPLWMYVPGSRFLPFTEGITIDSKPRPACISLIRCTKQKIRHDFIKSMAYAILSVRFVGGDIEPLNRFVKKIIQTTKHTDNGIKFSLDVNMLPSCQQPTVGDLYRIPRSQFKNDSNVFDYIEGRVVEDLGKTLKVISFFDEFHKRDEPKIFEIEARRAIKINDWFSHQK